MNTKTDAKNGFGKNKGLPFQNEAEQCALGAVLLDPLIAIPHVLGYLSAEDFYVPAHKAIFKAMKKLHSHGEPVDLVLLTRELKENDYAQTINGADLSFYLIQLADAVPTAENVKYYARILKRETNRRKRIVDAQNEIDDAYEKGGTLDKGFVKLADVLESVLDDNYLTTSEGRYSGFETGFPSLDESLNGLQKGELYIIAGRPSQGKSSFCTQIANHVYRMGGRVAFFPLEAGFKAQARNIAAMDTRTETWKLRKGKGVHQTKEEQDALIAYLEIQRKGIFNMSLSKTANGVAQTVREMISEHGGLDVIFVDHLQEMLPDNNDKWAKRNYQIETILQDLRVMAREFNIPIILAAQVGRSAEGREPSIAEIKDSGSIEQIADVVLIIHGNERGSGERTVNIAKNRNGATGKIKLWLYGEYLRFEERNEL